MSHEFSRTHHKSVVWCTARVDRPLYRFKENISTTKQEEKNNNDGMRTTLARRMSNYLAREFIPHFN